MTLCKRAEYLESVGIDTEIVCAGCSEDENKSCIAMYELLAIVDKSKEYNEVGE